MPRSFYIFTLFLLSYLSSPTNGFSQSKIYAPDVWQNILTENIEPWQTADLPLKYRKVNVQLDLFNTFLKKAPQRFNAESSHQKAILEMPFPDGTTKAFRIEKTNVMHSDLAAKFPEIHTFSGIGIGNKKEVLTLVVTPKGVEASISTGKNKIRIRPFSDQNNQLHISYYVKDLDQNTFEEWECEVINEAKAILKKDNPSLPESAGDCQLRTYRLALACTGGYAQKFGGTKNSVMTELVTTVAHLNGVLEKDLGIHLEMVPNNDDLIFLNPNTDGYTEGDRGAMINENVTICNNVVGSSNYDIGHLFSITGGGLAGVGVICGGSKARAVSGLSGNPSGYYFETIVLHEMGHQFSAGHTQNNDCNRSSFSAMETGSGSTLLSYAGVCAPNVQFPSDDYYHSISLQQIQSFTILGLGSNCPEIQDLGNILPDMDAGTDYILPTDTYFELEGMATNPDNDIQSFVWDQIDNEVATAPPVSNSTEGPTFRSIYPIDDPIRIFPNIDAIVEGITPTWEVLPSVERDMNFRFNVRDIHEGIGCAHEDDIELTFWDPPANQDFRVIDPETVVTWFVGDVMPIQWSPAKTYESPVECERVNIYLSKDGGYTYPILLAEKVLNEPGEYNLMVPNEVGSENRIKVKCSNNVFFDISNTDFSIEEPPVPTFLIDVTPQAQSVCGRELSEVTYEINLTPISGFTETITFSANGLPNGAIASFLPETIVAGGTVQVTISNLDENAEEGDFDIIINANSTSQSRNINLALQYFFEAPTSTKLKTPTNGASISNTTQSLIWLPNPGARGYQIEIATNPSFGANIIQTGQTQDTFYLAQNLEFETVYYWRIRGTNICGEGSNSMIYAFQTPGVICDTYPSEDVPVDIPGSGTGNVITTVSSLIVPENQTILDIKVQNMNLLHNYVGDMSATLTSPSGTMVALFDQPGAPATFFGCNGRDMEVAFDDHAILPQADLENQCGSQPPAISGIFQPLEPLSNFNNEEANGEWSLTISDFYPDADGGSIQEWSLEVCSSGDAPDSPDLLNNPLSIIKSQTGIISNQYLNATKVNLNAEDFTITLLSLPENGIISLNNTDLSIGDQFTQLDIDNGSINYTHDDSDTKSDIFYFNVLDAENGWLGAQIFNINIVSLPVAQAILVSDIDCYNNDNGSIEAQVLGGMAPYEFSLDGINFQSGSLFENLMEGTYQITVRDENGFESTSNQITITNPSEITATVNTAIYDLLIDASGGTGNLTYSSNGTDFQNENLFQFTQPGSFTIFIRDENGCETTTSATTFFIAQASILKTINCFGIDDGSIEINVSEGASPFEYSISGQDYQDEDIFNGLSAGTYSTMVRDAFGNEISTNTIILESPEELALSTSSNDFEITANASGGTGNLQYSINGTDYQNDNNFTVQNNGTYTITVRDENGCTTTSDLQIAINTLDVFASLLQEVSCFNTNDGTISVTVNGGKAPFQYSLNGLDFQDENLFENLSSGTYNITVLDTEGFIKETNEVTLQNPSALTLSLSSIDFDITANGNGGTGNLQYSINGSHYQNDNSFTVQNNGNYTLTLRDENGCNTSADIEISVNTLNAQAFLENDIICYNDTNASIQIQVVGGTPPLQYSLDGINFQPSELFTGLGAGTYTLIVMDAEGFTFETNEVTIINPDPIIANITVDVYDLIIDAEGGWDNFQYQLSGVSGIQMAPFFLCTAPGTYNVLVIDEKECQLDIQDVVVETPELLTDITINNPSCFGSNDGELFIWAEGEAESFQYSLDGANFQNDPVYQNMGSGNYTAYIKDVCEFVFMVDFEIEEPTTLTATIDISGPFANLNIDGGTTPYQYSLDGVNFQDENTFGPLISGDYTVEVIDSNGCILTENFVITYETMTFEGSGVTPIDCNDETVIIEICLNGGEGPFTWNTNPADVPVNEVSGNCDLNLEMEIPSGTYELIVADIYGITVSNSSTIAIPDPIELDLEINENNIVVNAFGGVFPYEYFLNGVAQSSNTFENLPNGDYTIEVIDANGCSIFEEIKITKTYEILSEMGFQIMPNPSNGHIFLKSRKSLNNDLNIKILDVVGRLVFESNWNKTEGTEKVLNLEGLANGVYQLIMEGDQFLGSEKIAIVK
ncbi:M12 family metallo-peptidase [Saprospiraceae bacterium]|nr:M12 family metallo-peptidase [Saprospiraceae bacterium]